MTSIVHGAGKEAIPIEWVYVGAEDFEWRRDTEHWPSPIPPMELWLLKHWDAGNDRAWAEIGMEAPAVFYRFQYAGPFLYARETPYEPERMMKNVMRYREVAKEYGGALRFWEDYCRPRIERVCRELAAADGRGPLLAIAELWGYGFHQTFTSLAPLFEPGMRMMALMAEAFGEDEPLTALEAVQSGDNRTQMINAEIWELAELARRTPSVQQALFDATADALEALRREPDAAAFIAAFDKLISRHGSRSQGWELTLPTWRERPEAVISLIRAHLSAGSASPAALAKSSETRREEAILSTLAKLPAEKHDEFTKLLGDLDGYIRIREDRAYWQMVLAGEMRTLLLRVGARLAEAGQIDEPADVFFLEPEDIEAEAASDLRPRVAERKTEWQRWREVEPPEVIGTPSAAAEVDQSTTSELKGRAASRGVATGPARIISSPEEGARLRPGDILVCVMSTPAWTPMFAGIAGIVAETGGALSHPAITAREYGIPAVVALKGATERIREGQIVTVDGAAGTVVLHAP